MTGKVDDVSNSTYYYERKRIEDETNRTEEVRFREQEEGYYNSNYNNNIEEQQITDEQVGSNVDTVA